MALNRSTEVLVRSVGALIRSTKVLIRSVGALIRSTEVLTRSAGALNKEYRNTNQECRSTKQDKSAVSFNNWS